MGKLKLTVVVDTCAMTAEVKCVEAVCEEKPDAAAGECAEDKEPEGECTG